MDKVDLDTAEGRRAYRDELNGVARPYRWAGLVFILIGAFVLWGSTRGWAGLAESAQVWGYGALALGWFVLRLWIAPRREDAGDALPERE